eukprot:s3056_g6.t1
MAFETLIPLGRMLHEVDPRMELDSSACHQKVLARLTENAQRWVGEPQSALTTQGAPGDWDDVLWMEASAITVTGPVLTRATFSRASRGRNQSCPWAPGGSAVLVVE